VRSFLEDSSPEFLTCRPPFAATVLFEDSGRAQGHGFLIFESSRLPHENITLAFARQKL